MKKLGSPLLEWSKIIRKTIFGKNDTDKRRSELCNIEMDIYEALSMQLNYIPFSERVYYSFMSLPIAGKKIKIPKHYKTLDGYEAYQIADGLSFIGHGKKFSIKEILTDISPMFKSVNIMLKFFGKLDKKTVERLFKLQESDRVNPYLKTNLSWVLALGGYNSDYSDFNWIVSSKSSFMKDTLALYLIFSKLPSDLKIEILIDLIKDETHPYVIETSLIALGSCKYKDLEELIIEKMSETRHKSVYTGSLISFLISEKRIPPNVIKNYINGTEWCIGLADEISKTHLDYNILNIIRKEPEYIWGKTIGGIINKKPIGDETIISVFNNYSKYEKEVLAFFPLMLYGILDSWWWGLFIFHFYKYFEFIKKLCD